MIARVARWTGILLFAAGLVAAQDAEIGGRSDPPGDAAPGPAPFVTMLGAGLGYGIPVVEELDDRVSGWSYGGDLRLAFSDRRRRG